MASDKNQTKEKSKGGEKGKKKNGVKETFAELKKVTWPTFGQTMKETGAVFVVTIFFLIILLAMDQLLSFAHSELVKGMGEINVVSIFAMIGDGLKNVPAVLSTVGGGFKSLSASMTYLPLF